MTVLIVQELAPSAWESVQEGRMFGHWGRLRRPCSMSKHSPLLLICAIGVNSWTLRTPKETLLNVQIFAPSKTGCFWKSQSSQNHFQKEPKIHHFPLCHVQEFTPPAWCVWKWSEEACICTFLIVQIFAPLQAIESSPSFRIFFQLFKNLKLLPIILESLQAIESSPSFRIFFQLFTYKHSRTS